MCTFHHWLNTDYEWIDFIANFIWTQLFIMMMMRTLCILFRPKTENRNFQINESPFWYVYTNVSWMLSKMILEASNQLYWMRSNRYLSMKTTVDFRAFSFPNFFPIQKSLEASWITELSFNKLQKKLRFCWPNYRFQWLHTIRISIFSIIMTLKWLFVSVRMDKLLIWCFK